MEDGSEPIKVKETSLLTAMMRNLYPRQLTTGIVEHPSDRGIYGAMNVDTTGRFIPSLTLLDNGKKKHKKPQGCAYFSNLSVLPTARRRGIGTTLIKEAERLAVQWGCWGASLHCSPQNTEAFQLYLKQGYKSVEGAPPDKNNCVFLAKVF